LDGLSAIACLPDNGNIGFVLKDAPKTAPN
jgi:hypothetical protein